MWSSKRLGINTIWEICAGREKRNWKWTACSSYLAPSVDFMDFIPILVSSEQLRTWLQMSTGILG